MTARAWAGPCCCAAVAVGLAVAPHLTALARTGTTDFLADGDDILYLSIARAPYHGEPALRDPFASPDDNLPTLYAWGQFVPAARAARWLGLSPLDLAILWRAGGATLLALAVYALFRSAFAGLARPELWSTLAALGCLADGGLVAGRPGAHAAALVGHMLRGTCPDLPNGLPQYRVVTPLTNLALPVVLATCLLPHNVRRWWAVVVGSLAMAGCVWVYFFHWTAAVVAGAGVIATWLLAAWRNPAERAEWLARARAATALGVVGLALGSPQIVSNLRTSGQPDLQPTLHRLSRGYPLPPDHALRTAPLRNTWMWAELALAGGLIVVLGLSRLAPLWWISAAGFALGCSALVTGLEFENFHWGGYVGQPFAVITLAAIVGLAGERPGWRRVRAVGLTAWAVSAVAVAAAWRPYEAARAAEPRENARLLAEFNPLRDQLGRLGPSNVLAGPAEARVALLHTRAAMLYQFPHSAHSCVQPDDAVHQRSALNAWVCGVSRDEYARSANDIRFQVGPAGRPEWEPEVVRAARLAWFDRLEAENGRPLLDRYHPDALLLPAGRTAPRPAGAWTRAASTGSWNLWLRPATPR